MLFSFLSSLIPVSGGVARVVIDRELVRHGQQLVGVQRSRRRHDLQGLLRCCQRLQVDIGDHPEVQLQLAQLHQLDEVVVVLAQSLTHVKHVSSVTAQVVRELMAPAHLCQHPVYEDQLSVARHGILVRLEPLRQSCTYVSVQYTR